MRCQLRIIAAATGLLLLAINAAMAATIVTSPPPVGDALAGMNRSIQPGVDFNQYANGGWLASTEIPADRSSTGVGRELTELTDRRTAELIRQSAASTAAAGSDERKIADFYASFMDEAGIEAKGLTVLKPTLAAIAAISDRVQLARFLGGTLRADVDVLNATNLYTDNVLGLWVAQDLDDPSRYVPFLLQGGLGMPDRDYYLDDSPH
ncbi:MAG TPA: M13 family metallopeptidase N-terminal domain-containing protein, partial [Steroidobacteraceae bacterium]